MKGKPEARSEGYGPASSLSLGSGVAVTGCHQRQRTRTAPQVVLRRATLRSPSPCCGLQPLRRQPLRLLSQRPRHRRPRRRRPPRPAVGSKATSVQRGSASITFPEAGITTGRGSIPRRASAGFARRLRPKRRAGVGHDGDHRSRHLQHGDNRYGRITIGAQWPPGP